jgi:hypothetical protein
MASGSDIRQAPDYSVVVQVSAAQPGPQVPNLYLAAMSCSAWLKEGHVTPCI